MTAPAERRMSRVDTAWLRMDNDVNLMMIVGVWLLTPAITLEALRERIKQQVGERLGDPALSVDGLALALNCSRRQLYNAFSEEPDGVAGYILRRRIEACRQTFDDRSNDRRSITDIAVAFGFSSMAHFSRVFRAHLGVPPSDYRRALLAGGA